MKKKRYLNVAGVNDTDTLLLKNASMRKVWKRHETKDSKKEKTTPATCVLCQGQHPANYKGCIVFKEMQNRKFPPLRSQPYLCTCNSTIRKSKPTTKRKP